MVCTAKNVESVNNAIQKCRTVEEIMKHTGLPQDIVEEAIDTLKTLGVAAADDIGRVCGIEAVKSLKDKFNKVCVLCNNDS